MKIPRVSICNGENCRKFGSDFILKRLESDKYFYKYPENFSPQKSSCMGNCQNAINIRIDGKIFSRQNPALTSKIVRDNI